MERAVRMGIRQEKIQAAQECGVLISTYATINAPKTFTIWIGTTVTCLFGAYRTGVFMARCKCPSTL
ncbi:hypothetical protein CRENPOLYSF1_170070 [Crenothrix polyspora]|uniref:Uncharacterized protein n=1 Tax=Crenothrix polyspora TaxID=360316 RepID=A0A1R4H4C9_9GAMM|nr:hypothetical protein CRENPOLYSF1_170070 [Crenothrix polyspora]